MGHYSKHKLMVANEIEQQIFDNLIPHDNNFHFLVIDGPNVYVDGALIEYKNSTLPYMETWVKYWD